MQNKHESFVFNFSFHSGTCTAPSVCFISKGTALKAFFPTMQAASAEQKSEAFLQFNVSGVMEAANLHFCLSRLSNLFGDRGEFSAKAEKREKCKYEMVCREKCIIIIIVVVVGNHRLAV